jgi:hypothetical protein
MDTVLTPYAIAAVAVKTFKKESEAPETGVAS